MLNQREAATACGVSRTTIRRRREAGDRPGAVQDAARSWLIPVDDLLAAGLRLHNPSPADAEASPGPEGHPVAVEPGTAALRAVLEHLRHAHALAVAEAQHLREQLAVRQEQLVAWGEHSRTCGRRRWRYCPLRPEGR
ncbi:hypothetical protein ABZ252_00010 [Streptomyces sp. NPDC006175]|uniref:helix-turn-helix transcriptional regulator n=1 Tax=Streptomyces sp. NPDC006175 TaxID=3154471 RepID=UPI0033A644F0